jgi:hypothetical protein
VEEEERDSEKKNIATLLLSSVDRRHIWGHISALHAFSGSPINSQIERGGLGRERGRSRRVRGEEKKERRESGKE